MATAAPADPPRQGHPDNNILYQSYFENREIKDIRELFILGDFKKEEFVVSTKDSTEGGSEDGYTLWVWLADISIVGSVGIEPGPGGFRLANAPQDAKAFENVCDLIRHYQENEFVLIHACTKYTLKLRSDTVLENQPYFATKAQMGQAKKNWERGEFKVYRSTDGMSWYDILIGTGEEKNTKFRKLHILREDTPPWKYWFRCEEECRKREMSPEERSALVAHRNVCDLIDYYTKNDFEMNFLRGQKFRLLPPQ